MRNAFAVVCATLLFSAGALGQSVPKTLVLDGALLEKHRAEHAAAESSRAGDIADLLKTADKILKAVKTYSVTKKSQTPPSGSKNDYMSQGPYWWPDPSKPNGLPYIRRDGERNPEINNIPDDNE